MKQVTPADSAADERAYGWPERLGPLTTGALLPFIILVYLGLRGGGYEVVTRSEVGIAIWALVAAFVLAGVLPLSRMGKAAWTLVGVLAAFTVWTGLGMIWSESAERSAVELGRVATLLGIFVLALLTQGGQPAFRRLLGATAAAVVVLSLVALASRFHPNLFPPNEVAEALPGERNRLNYPLGYWNGLATLVAIGMPLLLWISRAVRWPWVGAAATALLPVLALTTFFTLSRGGVVEIAVAISVLAAFHPRRLQLALPLLWGGLGSVVLIAAAQARTELTEGSLDSIAAAQGEEMTLITLAVFLVVGLVAWGTQSLLDRRGLRLPSPSAELSRRIAAGLAGVVVVVALIGGAPGEISDRWQQFKEPVTPGGGSVRLESTSGSGRYQWWDSAVEAGTSEPLLGIGAGTWEFWWARGDGGIPGYVREAHSLYLEAFGELGLPGALLITAFVGGILGVGGVRLIRRRDDLEDAAALAAGVAAASAFALAAAIDWAWELTVLPAAFLIIGAGIIHSTATARAGSSRQVSSLRARAGVAAAAGVALAVILPTMLSAAAISSSKASFDDGNLGAALADARRAEEMLPFSAQAKLQEALVLQAAGSFDEAAGAATEATEREPTNWRNWFALSEIERSRRNDQAASEALLKARELNPRSEFLAGS